MSFLAKFIIDLASISLFTYIIQPLQEEVSFRHILGDIKSPAKRDYKYIYEANTFWFTQFKFLISTAIAYVVVRKLTQGQAFSITCFVGAVPASLILCILYQSRTTL